MQDPGAEGEDRNFPEAVTHPQLPNLHPLHLALKPPTAHDEHARTAVASDQHAVARHANLAAGVVHNGGELPPITTNVNF